jgi:hypothetical protein
LEDSNGAVLLSDGEEFTAGIEGKSFDWATGVVKRKGVTAGQGVADLDVLRVTSKGDKIGGRGEGQAARWKREVAKRGIKAEAISAGKAGGLVTPAGGEEIA